MAASKDGMVVTQLATAARLARTALSARLIELGLYAGQDRILLALQEEEGVTPGRLAARLGVRAPTIAKAVGRLQEQGFVERRSSPGDGRQTRIHLTGNGRGVLEAIGAAVEETGRRALAGFDRKERKRLRKFLGRLEANLLSPPEGGKAA
jgi:DNA-binding MarR family transcriptional regulator